MTLADFDLAGRKVLITGAGRGIGKGIALVMAEAGADVAVTSLGEANAAQVAREVTALGRRSIGLAADGTSVEAMRAISADIIEALGGLDVVVNCVGDSIPGLVAEAPESSARVMTEADWHRVVDLNLTQAFVGCHVFGPHLLAQGFGSAINISSFAALRPAPNSSAYAAAKAGLTRFTESLALEWAPRGVRVNAIAPGQFPDPEQMTPEQFADREERGARGIPLGRFGRMRDVGLLAVYLASDAASYLTGVTIPVDGGRTLV
ncbi:MAG: SDR family oxidoreductase [Dehalococcoidia bacterium]|nr:SDR family oxidoreductase [Dehalococcoidia bacterium]